MDSDIRMPPTFQREGIDAAKEAGGQKEADSGAAKAKEAADKKADEADEEEEESSSEEEEDDESDDSEAERRAEQKRLYLEKTAADVAQREKNLQAEIARREREAEKQQQRDILARREAKEKREKEAAKRLAKLAGGVAVVKVGAAVVLLAWPVCCCVYVGVFLYTRVHKERRAHLVTSEKRTGGFVRWLDIPPHRSHRHSIALHAKGAGQGGYSGFVDRYGLLFEDFAGGNVAQKLGMCVFLTQRLAVGLAVGSVHSPDLGAGRTQVVV